MVKDANQMDLGERYKNDPHFNGPSKNRSCTDVICLLLFFVFIAAWVGVGLYALSHGDPRMFLVPRDSLGRRCGKDPDVKNNPYLLFHDLTKCLEITTPLLGCDTIQVCVSKCPSEYYHRNINHTNPPQEYCLDKRCPNWYLPSEPFEHRCVPVLTSINSNFLKNINRTMETLKKSVNEVKHAQEVGQNVVEDVIHSWWKILIGVSLALFACIIYILMLRWVAAPVIWFSIIGILVALGGGIYLTAQEYKDTKARYQTSDIPNEQKRLKTKRDIWLAALILLSSATFIIVLILIFLRKRIYLAIALIKEGSKAVSSVTASLFFPILPWVLQLGVISYAIVIALFLSTAAKPTYLTRNISDSCANVINLKNNMQCDPNKFSQLVENYSALCSNAVCKFIQMETSTLYSYLHFYNVVGFFWLTFFISALGEMTLAAVFAQWYWTWKKSQLPFFAVTSALFRTLRYHIGTLAFGSLIITICRMIRVCLEYIDRKLKKFDNELTRALMCLLKCFFYCLEKFLKFINKNAYIMCAIHGKNFCASAKDAFMLLMRNILRVFVLDKMTDFLFFISSLLLTLGVGAVSYMIFATDIMKSYIDNSALHYGIVPVIIIMISTYLISTFFFGVYSMAVDTLFLCFLEDCERNDGSSQKPYYMSKNLMRIFGKKNKAV